MRHSTLDLWAKAYYESYLNPSLADQSLYDRGCILDIAVEPWGRLHWSFIVWGLRWSHKSTPSLDTESLVHKTMAINTAFLPPNGKSDGILVNCLLGIWLWKSEHAMAC